MTTARKSTARKAPRKSTARKAPARKSTARKAAPRAVASAPVTAAPKAPAPGAADLAGGLRSYLQSVEAEVRAVSALSEQIDALVIDLNDLRDQQAKRLLVLDALRSS